MNKNIKRILALTLSVNAYGAISVMTLGTYLDFTTKPVYAASYSPSAEDLKSLVVKSTNGDTLDLRDGYNGSDVKLSEDKEYYVKLEDDSEGIKINAATKGDDYIVRIFTSDKTDATGMKPGEEIQLGKGNTTLYVRTYESLSSYRKAKDDKKDVTICEKEYIINIKKTTESSHEDNTQDPIYLEKLDLSKGEINFLKQRTSYDIKVASSVDEIKIAALPEKDGNRIRINGDLVDDKDNYKKTVSLKSGKNEIKIKVTDDEDNQRTYTLNITRGNASKNQDDIYLNDLIISEGKLDFSDEDTSYNVDLDESVSNVRICAEPEDEEYLVTINGSQVNSGDDYEKKISLSKGKNTVNIAIQDEINDKKRTYTLTINRGKVEENKDTKEIENTDNLTNTKSGWVETEAGWKYNDENGNIMKNAWLFDKEAGTYCYFNEDGLRKTGWFKENDKWYLLNDKGTMLIGWQESDGKKYMLDTKSGEMKTGWYKEEVADQSNTNTLSNTTSNVDANTSSNTNSSTNSINTITTDIAKTEKWYYLNKDGSMKTGWLADEGKWYYLNTDGTMQKGWLINSNLKYYLNADGTMATGTKTIDGKVCKFNGNGALII